jgi:hypothetical protein
MSEEAIGRIMADFDRWELVYQASEVLFEYSMTFRLVVPVPDQLGLDDGA